MLIVHLAVAVARHDRTRLSEVTPVLLRAHLSLTAFSTPLIVLKMVDLLILRIGCANCLLPVTHTVLKEYVRGLRPSSPTADSWRDTLRAMAKAWSRVHVCPVRLIRYLTLRVLPVDCLTGPWCLVRDIRRGGLSNSKFQQLFNVLWRDLW